MRVVLQRCSEATVKIDGEICGEIGQGLLLLLGIAPEDTLNEVEWMTNKVSGLRIFETDDGRMNRSVLDVNGEILVVSQFTLYGNCRKGRRPSFVGAGHPSMAEPLVEQFCQKLRSIGVSRVATGRFGANMKVGLINDGPVTLIIDSPEK